MSPDDFYTALSGFGIELTPRQKRQFADYFQLLLAGNQKVNLTNITDESDVYLKHFYDSLAPILYGIIENQPLQLLDIGAGAGFPSLPLKIIYPALEITIIDALNKRINFLTELTEALELTNVTLLHGRAEDFGRDAHYRSQFDVVTARAVARLNILAELTLPFLKKNGFLLALKSVKLDEELIEAKAAIVTLGGKYDRQIDYQLPNGASRHMALIKKTKETPNKYPRKAGTPGKKPL